MVDTTGDLVAALAPNARVVLKPGLYSLSSTIVVGDESVTIEAELPGTVVLDGQKLVRVLAISGSGFELVGLNITGGSTLSVRSTDSNQ